MPKLRTKYTLFIMKIKGGTDIEESLWNYEIEDIASIIKQYSG